jgi:hypothetical protein
VSESAAKRIGGRQAQTEATPGGAHSHTRLPFGFVFSLCPARHNLITSSRLLTTHGLRERSCIK